MPTITDTCIIDGNRLVITSKNSTVVLSHAGEVEYEVPGLDNAVVVVPGFNNSFYCLDKDGSFFFVNSKANIKFIPDVNKLAHSGNLAIARIGTPEKNLLLTITADGVIKVISPEQAAPLTAVEFLPSGNKYDPENMRIAGIAASPFDRNHVFVTVFDRTEDMDVVYHVVKIDLGKK